MTSNWRNRCCAATQPALILTTQGPSRGLRHFWRPFMSKTLPVPADTQPSEPCLVVFGRDEAGKPHASWFDAASAGLVLQLHLCCRYGPLLGESGRGGASMSVAVWSGSLVAWERELA